MLTPEFCGYSVDTPTSSGGLWCLIITIIIELTKQRQIRCRWRPGAEHGRLQPGSGVAMDNLTYSAFASAHPACSRQIQNLVRMEEAISSLGFAPFFEPVSVLDDFGPGTSPKLLGPLGAPLNAWTRHLAYGTIARVRDLTEPIVQHLLNRKLTVASILQRTVLENAGRAAYAVERLTTSSRDGSWDELRTLIPPPGTVRT